MIHHLLFKKLFLDTKSPKHSYLFFWLSLLTAFLFSCGPTTPHFTKDKTNLVVNPILNPSADTSMPFIIDGRPATDNDAVTAHTVSIFSHPGSSGCTGVIIAPHAVLTAAHCTANSDYFNIYFAKYFFAANSELTISTKNKIVHEDYSEGENDLAILFFEQDLPTGYSPVSLAKDPKDSATGQELIIAGYGVTKKTWLPSGDSYGTLNVGRSKIAFRLFDQSRFYTMNIRDQASVCYGDSGGPAFIEKNNNLYLVGISSQGDWVPPIPACTFGANWTRISYYYDWIMEQLLKINP